MAEAENLTVQILREIRDELKGTNARIDQTNARLDQTNERLDQTNERLGAVETTVNEMSEQLVFLVKHARNSARHQREADEAIDDLRQRMDRVEVHTGLKQS